jgi:hypothetical protein
MRPSGPGRTPPANAAGEHRTRANREGNAAENFLLPGFDERGLLTMETDASGAGLENEDSVVLRTFGNAIDAEMARQRLEGEGIAATVEGNDAAGWRAHPLDPTREFRLVVLGRDALRSNEILIAADL